MSLDGEGYIINQCDLLRLVLEALRTDLGLARRTLTGRRGPQKMDLANDWAITQRTCGSRNHVDLLMKKTMLPLINGAICLSRDQFTLMNE